MPRQSQQTEKSESAREMSPLLEGQKLIRIIELNSYAKKVRRKRKLINDDAVKKRANGWKKNEL